MQKNIGLIGTVGSTMQMAPYGSDAWEFWGVGQVMRFEAEGKIPECDVIFEVHRETTHPGPWKSRRPRYEEQPDRRYVFVDEYPEFPNSIVYPIEEVRAQIPLKRLGHDRDYLTSSMAWMLALAITKRPEKIGIWGANMDASGEYGWQKPCAEWLLGFAEAKGIEIVLPDLCTLLKSGFVYGLELAPHQNGELTTEAMDIRIKQGFRFCDEAKALLRKTHGKKERNIIIGEILKTIDQMQEINNLRHHANVAERGGAVAGGQVDIAA